MGIGYVMRINTQCPLCKSNIECLSSLYKQTEICSSEQLTVAQMSPKFAHTQSFLPARNGDPQTIGLYEVKFNVTCDTCGLVFTVPFVLEQTTSTLHIDEVEDEEENPDETLLRNPEILRQYLLLTEEQKEGGFK